MRILRVLLLIAVIFACITVHCVRGKREKAEQQRAAAQAALPSRVLWVWERPENVAGLHAAGAGIAVLEQTLLLGAEVHADSRRQPLIAPSGLTRITVVRIETSAEFAAHVNDRKLMRAVAASLAQTARKPGIAALEIDFDAKRSERPFYRKLLFALREEMPPTLPLDITALASWCSTDDWIGDLPINEAAPMFFRMEPDRRRVLASPTYRIREPLCMGSIGVSTREPWPSDVQGKRVYIFAERGWAADFNLLPASRRDGEPQ